jgi:hypothetical protein
MMSVDLCSVRHCARWHDGHRISHRMLPNGMTAPLAGKRWFARSEGGTTMKYLVISRSAPGIENARKAREVFLKAGLPAGAETTLAAVDGKTFISIVDTDEPDMVMSSTYAPFFEETTTIPVAALDDAWMTAVLTAQDNWG